MSLPKPKKRKLYKPKGSGILSGVFSKKKKFRNKATKRNPTGSCSKGPKGSCKRAAKARRSFLNF